LPQKSKEYVTEYSIKKFKSPQNLAPKKKKGGWGRGGEDWNGYVERSSRATLNKKLGKRNRSNKRLVPQRDMKGGYDEYLGKCCIQKPHP